MKKRTKIIIGTIVAILGLSACGGSRLTTLAQETCEELEGAIVLQVGGILSSAISEAEDLGATGPELGDAMREECPDIMLAIEAVADDQAEREREQEARDNLVNEVSVDLEGCYKGDNEARGTVTNNSRQTVDVFIDVEFLDDGGVLVNSSLGSVSGLRPGETGRWSAYDYDDARYTQCRASVGSVFES